MINHPILLILKFCTKQEGGGFEVAGEKAIYSFELLATGLGVKHRHEIVL